MTDPNRKPARRIATGGLFGWIPRHRSGELQHQPSRRLQARYCLTDVAAE